MAWFAVDTSFHSHPKRIAAGDAPVGLWTACGSYCADHLTDGLVPGAIARLYGKPAGAKALIRVRLWHGTGHDCERCVQPADGDYVMHDYLEYNPSREEVEAERRKARETKSRAGRAGGIASGVARRRNGSTKQTASRDEAQAKHRRSTDEAEGKQNEASSPILSRTPPNPPASGGVHTCQAHRRPRRGCPDCHWEPRSTTDERVQAGLDLAAKYAAMDGEMPTLVALPGGAS